MGVALSSHMRLEGRLYSVAEQIMRIQTRLFLGTAALVLALMGLQWWLYARQLRSIENEVTRVATTVGTSVLTAERAFFGKVFLHNAHELWIDVNGDAQILEEPSDTSVVGRDTDLRIVRVPETAQAGTEERQSERVIRKEIVAPVSESEAHTIEWVIETHGVDDPEAAVLDEDPSGVTTAESLPENARKLVVAVEDGDKGHDRYLVVREDDQAVHRIPIPVSPAVAEVRDTMREGAAMGGALLLVGLVASAALSRRLARPLRTLATGTEALGRGELGYQVPVSASGEIGDLQRAFNLMSARLAELEAERELWLEREHLAQLGDLSRGLAHTLRNPLHTLGLAVEELASDSGGRQDLVATSRAQIRRIDRWLRSFLAIGAGEATEPEPTDIGELVQAVALESVQQGADVRVFGGRETVRANVVPGAVRAAVANLIENATEVSPDGTPVEVNIAVEGREAVISIVDGGPGLPDAVRERLFSPHVTTKIGGSGMGLFLARQLVVGMHGGSLEMADRVDGGTVATVRLPLVVEDARDG
jgi:signal transduction histidine kinase